MGKTIFSFLSLLGLALLFLLPGCHEDEKSMKFSVLRLDVGGRNDVKRNQHIAIEFSRPVARDTVNRNTIWILSEKGPGEWEPYPGRFGIEQNRVLFYPTVLLEDREEDLPINGKGFEANTKYKVVVPNFFVNLSSTVKSENEFDPVADTFVGVFETSASFENEWEEPLVHYVDVRNNLEEEFFSAAVSIKFSEPVKEKSFEEGAYLTHNLSGERLPVFHLSNEDYTLFTLIPQAEVQRGGLEKAYSLHLTRSITDLAENPLYNLHTGVFPLSTEILVNQIDVLIEDFSTRNCLDERETSLRWSPQDLPGFLASSPSENLLLVRGEGPPYSEGELFWGQKGQKINILLPGSSLGPRGQIEEIGWIPRDSNYSHAFFANTALSLRIAESPNRTPSLLEKTSVPTYSPVLSPEGFVPLPFSRPISFHGRESLELELTHDGGTGTIPWKTLGEGEYALAIRIRPNSHTAMSKFYDMETPHPQFRLPIVHSTCSFSSTCIQENFEIVFQGAHEVDPDKRAPTHESTDFLKEIDLLENHQFVRFQLTFLTEDPSLRIDSITILY